MAARCRQRLEQDVIPYKAGRQAHIEVPQDRAIRRITMKFEIKVNAGVTPPTNRKNLHYLNIIKAIILDLNGGVQKIFIDGKSKYFSTLFELGVYPTATSVIATPAANNSTTYKVTFNLDFAQQIQTLSDFSALLNAPAIGSLNLIVDWGLITDIFGTANTATIDTDDTKVTISYVEVFDNGSSDGVDLQAALNNAVDIRERIDTPTAIDKEYDSFGTNETSIDILPVPSLILSQMIMTFNNITDGNPLLDNDVIKHFSVENVRAAGEPIIIDSWERYHDTLKMDYRLQDNTPAGVGFVNWVDQRQGGLRNGAIDALKIKILTKAPTANKKNGVVLLTKFIPGGVALESRVT